MKKIKLIMVDCNGKLYTYYLLYRAKNPPDLIIKASGVNVFSGIKD